MNNKTPTSPDTHVHVSKLLSRILRHAPESVGITLDTEGWVAIDTLVRAIAQSTPARLRELPAISGELILAVAASSDKQRFSISDDGLRIRAAQGHSIAVDLGYAPIEPPAVLYHGTALASWNAIEQEGLRAGRRHAVHLSADIETARRVGARHGKPIVLGVDAARMHRDGLSFSRADNGVWLTAQVPPVYLSRLDI